MYSRGWDGYKTTEGAEDLIVRGIIRDLIALTWMRYVHHCCKNTYSVDITNNRSDSGKTGSTSRNDANVLIGVLAILSLAVCMIVQVGDSLAKG